MESAVDKTLKVPPLVTAILAFLRKSGMNCEGIFRLSPASHQVKEMQVLADRGSRSSFYSLALSQHFHPVGRFDFHPDEVIAVAALLKMFLRDMPDPLLTSKLYNDFIATAGTIYLTFPCVSHELWGRWGPR